MINTRATQGWRWRRSHSQTEGVAGCILVFGCSLFKLAHARRPRVEMTIELNVTNLLREGLVTFSSMAISTKMIGPN